MISHKMKNCNSFHHIFVAYFWKIYCRHECVLGCFDYAFRLYFQICFRARFYNKIHRLHNITFYVLFY